MINTSTCTQIWIQQILDIKFGDKTTGLPWGEDLIKVAPKRYFVLATEDHGALAIQKDALFYVILHCIKQGYTFDILPLCD